MIQVICIALADTATIPPTRAYCVYCVTFYSFYNPESFRRHALAGFPRGAREMWVWKRTSHNLLLKCDPAARWEKSL